MVMNMMQPTPVFFPKGHFPPMTNTERQAEFRRRNPGYYQRLHARRRAAVRALMAERKAAALAAAPEQVSVPKTLTLPLPTWRLALPAPVVDPLMVELNALTARLARTHDAIALPAMTPAEQKRSPAA
jgi:hypothetical protein